MPYYVLYLRPVGNAVVPLSDEHPLEPLTARPYTGPREICQCLSLVRMLRAIRGKMAHLPRRQASYAEGAACSDLVMTDSLC